jgi:hypothetical protein
MVGPRRLLAVVGVAGSLLGCGVTSPTDALERQGPFRGQVVNLETGEPIAGAIVTAVWWENLFPSGVQFYDAREAVTSADGRFEIPQLSIPATKLNVGSPRLTFFAPGYLPPGHYREPGDPTTGIYRIRYRVTPPDGQPFVAPTVVPMRRIRSEEEWCEYRYLASPGATVPAAKVPLFGQAFRKEAQSRGGCHPPTGTGRKP